MNGRQPVERILFLIALGAYGYFHQGGGWNQNSRFVQVRAIVENGRLSVNELLDKQRRKDPPLLFPAPFVPSEDVRKDYRFLSTLDVSLHDGRLYPNKPPGATLLALPPYALLYAAERAAGIGPDAWWALTLNLFLVSFVSVALVGAIGVVLFHRTSYLLFPALPAFAHAAAALTFALGTLMFPYATMLFDHVPVAVFLLASFYLLLRAREADPRTADRHALVAGLWAGAAVLVNYNAVLAGVPLALYAGVRRGAWFSVGAFALPAVLLAVYHAVCFGSPWILPQSLSVIPIPWTAPRLSVLLALLFSSYRGLFFSSPVLLLAAYGLARLGRERRAEAVVFVSIVAAFLAMNVCFLNWHGGGCFGPRYLIPALPFLALGLAPAFARWRVATTALASLAALVMLLVTAVNPQLPPTVCRPVGDYYLPLLAGRTFRAPGIKARGPVSAHRGGVYRARTPAQARWSSFNFGELLFPESVWSLAPLVLGLGVGMMALRRAVAVPTYPS